MLLTRCAPIIGGLLYIALAISCGATPRPRAPRRHVRALQLFGKQFPCSQRIGDQQSRLGLQQNRPVAPDRAQVRRHRSSWRAALTLSCDSTFLACPLSSATMEMVPMRCPYLRIRQRGS